MSVVAPPEVERPHEPGWERFAERVTRYRTWTRAQQTTQLGVTLTVLVLVVGICAVGGQPPWEPSAVTLGLLTLAVLVAFAALEVFWDGRGLPRRVRTAEPLPDGALEIGVPALEALAEPSRLVTTLLFGALAGGLALVGDASEPIVGIVVGIVVGIGAGRIAGLELLLRLVVERADPRRTFFLSLDDDELDAPLLWRSAF